jgi:hypothetical protein
MGFLVAGFLFFGGVFVGIVLRGLAERKVRAALNISEFAPELLSNAQPISVFSKTVFHDSFRDAGRYGSNVHSFSAANARGFGNPSDGNS